MAKQIAIGGNTYAWRNELARAGLTWNSTGRRWEGQLNDTFAATQIANAIESGELVDVSWYATRNGPGMQELDNQ